jgi:DMSO/TMAO reductase YedYZ molybdopterin-dependent catalytic subunit
MLRPKKRPLWAVLPVFAFVLLLALTAGCGKSSTGTTAIRGEPGTTIGSSGVDGDSGALEIIGTEGTKVYSLDQIESMQYTEGYGGMKSSTGRITPPTMVKGVLIGDLFAEVGGVPDDMAVSILAKDGYEMTVSAAQLKSGDFLTYDMVTGEERKVEGPLKVILAYEYDGKPINPDSEGPLRLAIVSPQNDQVTDGHWWVKWVTQIQIKPIEQEWSLELSGARTEEVDRPTFETCSASGCHGRNWTSADGNQWTGVPLYLLVGRVDDEVAHEGPAYNRDLAQAGYDVEIVSADGTSTTINSKTMYYNKDLIVAYKLNGDTLSEDYWPLRLVGEGIDPSSMVGQITEIRALLPAK